MKRTGTLFITIALTISFMLSPVSVSANTPTITQNEQLIQLLMQMIELLKAQLAVLTENVSDSESVQDVAKVVYPNGGEEFMTAKGAFVAKWTPSETPIDLYLTSQDGDHRYEKLGKKLTGGSVDVQLGDEYLGKSVSYYRIQVCISGTKTCDVSDAKFSFVDTTDQAEVIASPVISSISPTQSSGKDIDLVTIYGEHLVPVGDKGGDVSITLGRKDTMKTALELKGTDSPMTILTGVYLSPADTDGTRMQARIDTDTLTTGTYLLELTIDGRTSNSVEFYVQ